MNAAVLRGLEVEDYVRPGTIRAANVTVGGYRCPDWQDARYLLARLCDTLDGFEPPEGSRYAFSILKAIFAHVYLAWIHPFGDGNGRTARLVETGHPAGSGSAAARMPPAEQPLLSHADRVLQATRAREPAE